MNIVDSTRLVAGREMRETFRRKSFWVVFAVLLLGATAAMVVPDLLKDDSNPKFDVAVVGTNEPLDQALESVATSLDLDVTIRNVDQVSQARDRVADDRVDVGIVPGEDPRVIVRSDADGAIVTAARQALASRALIEQLEANGLSRAEITSVTELPAPRVQEVDEQKAGRQTTAFVISFVLYLLLLSLMIQVANGVAIEKANRISEVLLAIVRPGALLFGKVLGVGVVGIVAIAAGALPVVAKLLLGGDLPEGIGGALAGSALWFVLGLILYLTISGALGALVERQEQTGSVVAPLTFLLIGTFIAAQSSADSAFGTVLAYFPLTSPLMVPFRIATGVSSPVELVVSLSLLVAAIALAGRIGSTVYSRAIVRTGRRMTLREALSNG